MEWTMKGVAGAALALLVTTGCITTREVVVEEDAPTQVSPAQVDAQLSPYGTWVYVDGVGRVWQPSRTVVGASFYPYATSGRWVMVDGEWWFDSSYPFAPVVYHYGRWYFDPFYGWVWVPGYQWAPAWVVWRSGGGYVGWAPMGPTTVVVHDTRYVYVHEQDFTRRDPYVRALPPSRAHQVERVTRVQEGRGPAVVSSQSRRGGVRAYDGEAGSRSPAVIRGEQSDAHARPSSEPRPEPRYARPSSPSYSHPSPARPSSPSYSRPSSSPSYSRPSSSPSYSRPAQPIPRSAPASPSPSPSRPVRRK